MKRALVFTFIIAMLLSIASFAEENTVFVTLEGKGHNPNYTESAVKLTLFHTFWAYFSMLVGVSHSAFWTALRFWVIFRINSK